MAEDRTVVKTYVPRHQKETWQEHAERLDMSQSEFVRAMVQAGRRGFGANPVEEENPDATPGVDGLKSRVLDALDEDHQSWETLRERVGEDLDDRLEVTLRELQSEGRVTYSARNGGYARNE